MHERSGPPCTCYSVAVIDERRHDVGCHRRQWIEAVDRARSAEAGVAELAVQRDEARAEVERLREGVRTLRAYISAPEGKGPLRYIEALELCDVLVASQLAQPPERGWV